MLALNKISTWVKADYLNVTASVIASMSKQQIAAMAHPDWLSPSAVSGFTAQQVASISISFYWMSATWLNALSPSAFAAIPVSQISNFTSNAYAGLDSAHISALTNQQVAAMAHPDWLSPNAVAGFSAQQVASISISFYWMSPTWLNALSPAAFAAIPASQISNFSPNAYAGLDRAHISSMSNQQIAAIKHPELLSPSAIAGITAQQMASISVNFNLLSAAWFNALSPATFGAIPASQVSNFSSNAYAGLDGAHISSMSNQQIAAIKYPELLSPSAIACITAEQMPSISVNLGLFSADWLNALSPSAFAAIPSSKISNISSNAFASLDALHISALTNQQVAAMTNQQVAEVQNPDWLSLSAVTGITAGQVVSISFNFSLLSADWLNALSPATFAAIPASQVSNFSTVAYAGLDQAHILALTNQQLAAVTNEQVNSMTSQQVALMNAPELLSLRAVAGFTAEQMSSISVNFSLFSADWLNALSLMTFAAIPASQVSNFSSAAYAGLDSAHISALTNQQVAALTNLQVAAMTNQQVAAMTNPEFLSLSAVSSLTAEQVASINANFSLVSADWLNALTQAAFAAIPASQFSNFSTLAYAGLDVADISSLTNQQLASVTIEEIVAMTTQQVAALVHPELLSPSVVAGFTAEQIASIEVNFSLLSAEWLNALSPEVFAAIPASQISNISPGVYASLDGVHISAMTNLQVSTLTGQQVAAMTNQQVAAMNHLDCLSPNSVAGFSAQQIASISVNFSLLSSDWLNALSPTAFAAIPASQVSNISSNAYSRLDPAQISALTKQQVEALTKQQVAVMTNQQFAAMNHPELLTPSAVTGFTAQQMSSMGVDFSLFNADWLNALSPTVFAAIPASQLIHISPSAYAGLDVAHISAMTNQQVAVLTNQQVDAMTNQQLAAMNHPELLTPSSVAGFTAQQMSSISVNFSLLSSDWLNALSPAAFAAIPVSQISNISSTAYAGLDAGHVSAMTNQQVAAMKHPELLSASGVAGFTAQQMSSIGVNFNSFTATWLSALSPSAFAAIPASQVSNFSSSVYASISGSQIAAMTKQQVAAMTHPDWLTPGAVAGFTAQQIPSISISFYWISSTWLSALSPAAFAAIPASQIGSLTTSAYAGIDGAQISGMTNQQLTAMSHLNLLSAGAISGFTAQQIASMNVNFNSFSAAWINALSPAAFAAIPASQVSNFSSNVYATLDGAHISAMTNQQVAAMNHPDWLSPGAVAGFSAQQIANISISFYWISATWLNALNPAAFAAIPTSQFSKLQSSVYVGLDGAHILALTDLQIVAMGKNITYLQAQYTSDLQLSKLSLSQFQDLTVQQCLSMSDVQIQSLSVQQLSVWSGEQVATIGSRAVLLSSDAVSQLSNDELLQLSSNLSPLQISNLSSVQQNLLLTSNQDGALFFNGLSDSSIKSVVGQVLSGNQSLFSFASIESVFKSFSASLTGGLTSAQYSDLKSYVSYIGQVLGINSSEYSVVNGLINGANNASIDWTATGSETRIPNLAVGSTSAQFNQLISAWLDGADDPVNSGMFLGNSPLFNVGVPQLSDINQYGIGDCFYLADIGAVTISDPSFIQSMIQENSNGSYSVRFFNGGKADWVTVDAYDYSDGAYTASNSNWVSIFERAYVAFRSTYLGMSNSYNSINGGDPTVSMANITGDSVSYIAEAYNSESNWDTNIFSQVKTDLAEGEALSYCTSATQNTTDANGKTEFVGSHCFTIQGIDQITQDLILSNPWGASSTSGFDGTFEVSMDQLWQGLNGHICVNNSYGATGSAGQLIQALSQVSNLSLASSSSPVIQSIQATAISPLLITASR